jgi:hypothetical protein
MTNREVANAFAKGISASTTNLWTNGAKIFSYSTLMAQRLPNGTIIVNACKYSNTTSHHQSYIRAALEAKGEKFTEVGKGNYIPFGTYDLTSYLKKAA